MKLKIRKLHPDAIVPKYATDGAACFDLHAVTIDNFETSSETIPGTTMVIATGLAFEVPEGYALMIYSRSGHGFKNYTRLVNCVGVIDSDYRGEVMVKLATDSLDDGAADPLNIKPGARIAQACLVPCPRVEFEVVDQLSETARGDGFGSTGLGAA
jgi:dUTP pyrophosphatase